MRALQPSGMAGGVEGRRFRHEECPHHITLSSTSRERVWEAAPLPPAGPGGLQGGGIKVPDLHWWFCPRATTEATRAWC